MKTNGNLTGLRSRSWNVLEVQSKSVSVDNFGTCWKRRESQIINSLRKRWTVLLLGSGSDTIRSERPPLNFLLVSSDKECRKDQVLTYWPGRLLVIFLRKPLSRSIWGAETSSRRLAGNKLPRASTYPSLKEGGLHSLRRRSMSKSSLTGFTDWPRGLPSGDFPPTSKWPSKRQVIPM
jgi:hypothetical protein